MRDLFVSECRQARVGVIALVRMMARVSIRIGCCQREGECEDES